MKALREEEGGAPATELVRSYRPLAESVARRQRVLAALRERRTARPAPWWPRAIAVGSLLVAVTATATVVKQLRVAPSLRGPVAPPASSPRAPSSPRVLAPRAVAPAPLAEPPVTQPVPPPVSAPLTGTFQPGRLAYRSKRDMPKTGPMAAPLADKVLAAFRALRVDNDPVTAAALLAEYRAAEPAGTLGEEALALEIEAMMATGNGAAIELAAEYLTRFPSGRWRRLAEHARSAFPLKLPH